MTDFLWGAATSSYQIEGAANEDGRGLSIWDTFSHTPGKVWRGHTGDIAVDHYHRYAEDVLLMAKLGLQAYRFSIAWPRVMPSGAGAVNRKGLDFYERLVDCLLEQGIKPWATLYHWDLPQALEDAGGWPNRDTAQHFADYASVVYDCLGDRVSHWMTVNEPWCASFLGYASGVHAPGRTEPVAAVRAAHHLLLAHGWAASRLSRATVGVALNLTAVSPQTSDPADIDAARRIDGLHNRLFLDPVLLGRLPADVVADLAGVTDLSHVRADDLADIHVPLDFLGINYYTPTVVSGQSATPLDRTWVGSEHVAVTGKGLPRTGTGWEIEPTSLQAMLERLHREYPAIPLYITENGAAFDDELDDPQRIAFLAEHLDACQAAIGNGVPLRGYFAWSLLDNFEWALGYDTRFGLVHVGPDQKRTLKASAHWYARTIAERSIPAGGVGFVEGAGWVRDHAEG